MSAAALRKRIPDSPIAFEGTLATLVDAHMSLVMPEPGAVEQVHSHLERYCASASPLLLLCYESASECGLECPTEPGGAVIRWTDNAPSWAMHQATYAGLTWSADEFKNFIHNLPFEMFAV